MQLGGIYKQQTYPQWIGLSVELREYEGAREALIKLQGVKKKRIFPKTKRPSIPHTTRKGQENSRTTAVKIE